MPDKEFTRRTIDLWQPRTARELAEEDAREITANMSGFFRLLTEWDRDTHRKQENSRPHQEPAEA
jgi:hypothetical protein